MGYLCTHCTVYVRTFKNVVRIILKLREVVWVCQANEIVNIGFVSINSAIRRVYYVM